MRQCLDCTTILEPHAGRGRPSLRCTHCNAARHVKREQERQRRRKLTAGPCREAGCTGSARTRGLCPTHYNRTLPNRHRKILINCHACGTEVLRDPSVTKWARNYCSDMCQMWDRWAKSLTSPLPAEHWGRTYGACSHWHPPVIERVIACEWCGTERASASRYIRFCTRMCKVRANKAKRRGTERNAQGTYTWMDITRLWESFDRACAYCATPTPLADIQAEHVHPLSKGGRNDLSNLLPSCGPCNSDKRDLTLSEWNPDRLRRNLKPVRATWAADDPRYRHLITQDDLNLAA